jgi:hypothetical protein
MWARAYPVVGPSLVGLAFALGVSGASQAMPSGAYSVIVTEAVAATPSEPIPGVKDLRLADLDKKCKQKGGRSTSVSDCDDPCNRTCD